MFKFVFLWTDISIWAAGGLLHRLCGAIGRVRYAERSRPAGVACSATRRRCAPSLVLALCMGDHGWPTACTTAAACASRGAGSAAGSVQYEVQAHSLLDLALADLIASRETSYSRPARLRRPAHGFGVGQRPRGAHGATAEARRRPSVRSRAPVAQRPPVARLQRASCWASGLARGRRVRAVRPRGPGAPSREHRRDGGERVAQRGRDSRGARRCGRWSSSPRYRRRRRSR